MNLFYCLLDWKLEGILLSPNLGWGFCIVLFLLFCKLFKDWFNSFTFCSDLAFENSFEDPLPISKEGFFEQQKENRFLELFVKFK